ncbi:MAG: hypothetical protein HKP61_15545 [Dactylosporangium sp.]|nr:hypothetical protein [Dactylosporangium sp.]NNJ62320.1 hypothetical protein [Dactylosporangium sp.]
MDELSLEWNIENVGSASLVWNFRGEAVKVRTTYVGDGLGSLVQAAIDLRRGSSSAIAFLPAEPGGNCIFFAGAAEGVYVQIVSFCDMESEHKRWSGGVLRWQGSVDTANLILQVRMLTEALLERYDTAELYAGAWQGASFPLEKLEILRDDNP